jgi:transposase
VSKRSFVGIDVSKDRLDVERANEKGEVQRAQFDNLAAGHLKLVGWLRKQGDEVKVVLEATGAYHVKLAMVLAQSKGIEVMVANPMSVKHFRDALLQRARTDATSATMLREYAQRMEFVRWTPPSRAHRDLRAVARRVEALTKMRTEEKNRLHAAREGGEPAVVLRDTRANIVALGKRLETLRGHALKNIHSDAELEQKWKSVRSVKGIGDISAIAILAELVFLSPQMAVRQWVAYAGLDPRPVESGTSVYRPARISKVGNVHLRRALYMPALVAMRHNAPVKAFAEHLRAKGKPELVIVTAVMRKLLHSIYGMLKSGSSFEAAKFFRTEAADRSMSDSLSARPDDRSPEPPPEAPSVRRPRLARGAARSTGQGRGRPTRPTSVKRTLEASEHCAILSCATDSESI